eukprot:TRINITY_DN10402_c0_g2_i1.p1 TRINITY_DN10402_c0_g2~~TRINITY_DN10402_c0_g2_i1.p1  ORF type:complete len:334 (+),score=58.11 TRINITY_DN10402_c0_g2_i1:183-1184(+)
MADAAAGDSTPPEEAAAGTPTSDAAACFPPTDVLCSCHHVPVYCCPNETPGGRLDDPLNNFMLQGQYGGRANGGAAGGDGGGSSDAGSADAAGCFMEREQALKERFLALEERAGSVDDDAHLLSFFDDETEEDRREREYRLRRQQLEEEDRLAELDALQAIYARASKRAFRRLKNLPEPPPGCSYVGGGEEEDSDPPGNAYPGDGEESAWAPGYYEAPPYAGAAAAAGPSDGERANAGGELSQLSQHSQHSPGAVVSRLRRRRRQRFRQEVAAAVAPAPEPPRAAGDPSKEYHQDAQEQLCSPQGPGIAPAPPARHTEGSAAAPLPPLPPSSG